MAIKTSRYLGFQMYQKYGVTPEMNFARMFKEGDSDIDMIRKMRNLYFKNIDAIMENNQALFEDENKKKEFINEYNNLFFNELVDQKIYNPDNGRLVIGNDQKVEKKQVLLHGFTKISHSPKDFQKTKEDVIDDFKYSTSSYSPKELFVSIFKYNDDKNLTNLKNTNIDKIRESATNLRNSEKFSKDLNTIAYAASELKKNITAHENKGFFHRLFNYRRLGKARTEYNNLVQHLNTFGLSEAKLEETMDQIQSGTVKPYAAGKFANVIKDLSKSEASMSDILPFATKEEYQKQVKEIGEKSEKEAYEFYKDNLYKQYRPDFNDKINFGMMFEKQEVYEGYKYQFEKKIEAEEDVEDKAIDSNELYDENGQAKDEEVYVGKLKEDLLDDYGPKEVEIDEDQLENLNIGEMIK